MKVAIKSTFRCCYKANTRKVFSSELKVLPGILCKAEVRMVMHTFFESITHLFLHIYLVFVLCLK